MAAAIKAISAMAAKGALGSVTGKAGTQNVQRAQQVMLDVLANDILLKSCEWGGLVAGMASEELDDPYPVPGEFPRGRFLLVFDPLDGSSNADVNVSVGTIFSILRHDKTEAPTVEDFLQKGTEQVMQYGDFFFGTMPGSAGEVSGLLLHRRCLPARDQVHGELRRALIATQYQRVLAQLAHLADEFSTHIHLPAAGQPLGADAGRAARRLLLLVKRLFTDAPGGAALVS